jgi:CubicO group peptidase (beta-lactamase class C family)
MGDRRHLNLMTNEHPGPTSTSPTMTRILVIAAVLCLAGSAMGTEPSLPEVSPADAGMSAEKLAEIDAAVASAIEAKKMRGCVVLVGRRGGVVHRRAYGQRQVEPTVEPMTVDTVFDVASLTKPVATATAIMQLVDAGKLTANDTVANHLSDFSQSGKDKVTVEELLLHTSGLIADNPLRDYLDGEGKAWERVFALKLQQPSGERFVYSDVNFLVLGKLVEQVSGQTLDEYCAKNIFSRIGMEHTGYIRLSNRRDASDDTQSSPAAAGPKASGQANASVTHPASMIAPTEKREGEWIRGEVHDPRAYALDGVAGHAGVFSTADDLALYAIAMLNRGLGQNGQRLFSEDTWRLMTQPRPVPGGLRAFGWDVKTGFSSNRGKGFSAAAFGHGGFTGTAVWIDPELDLYVVFLSSRLHPDGKGSVNPLAGEIGTIASEAIQRD